MHFIEEFYLEMGGLRAMGLHTSKRMHFIEEEIIRAQVFRVGVLHTSKRMHFIEDVGKRHLTTLRLIACIRQNVCTSLRMPLSFTVPCTGHGLAYVKTYALH